MRELSWTHNLLIMSRSKRDEEREFYLRVCVRESGASGNWNGSSPGPCSSAWSCRRQNSHQPLTEFHPDAAAVFKDTYLVEFLDLPPEHSEADLQRALVEQLKQFLIELGRDFCFIDGARRT